MDLSKIVQGSILQRKDWDWVWKFKGFIFFSKFFKFQILEKFQEKNLQLHSIPHKICKIFDYIYFVSETFIM